MAHWHLVTKRSHLFFVTIDNKNGNQLHRYRSAFYTGVLPVMACLVINVDNEDYEGANFQLTPKCTYAANTPPAIVAKPPVITACISDLVMSGSIGRIINGASV